MSNKILFLLLILPFHAALSVGQDWSYTIVVSEETDRDPAWSKVVVELKSKYPEANQITWKQSVNEALQALSDQHPRYSCFVARPNEVTRQYVASIHQLTRQLDQDPYCDTLWGILTGYDAENAIRIAGEKNNLTIERVASGTEIALSMCQEGVWYDELEKHKKVEKTRGGVAKQEEGPADTTEVLASTVTDPDTDLFVTSGHATERNWQIGFRYKNGFFQSKSGKMYGRTTTGERFRIQSTTPKVYLAVGNCLMGHIDGPDAMALAWLNDVGMNQMVGYTVLTWYGYSGWGILDYFLEQPGRYSLTEAFHANQHALIHRINSFFPSLTGKQINTGSRDLPTIEPNKAGRSLGLTSFDSRGLLWDRDTVAFYGDPAWHAKMASMPKAYEQNLTIEDGVYTFTITPNLGEQSFAPVNTNGSQRGGRPIVEFLPSRIKEVEILEGQQLQPIITDDFILVPNLVTQLQKEPLRIQFRASLVK